MPAEAYVAAPPAAKNAADLTSLAVRRPGPPHFCYRALVESSSHEANVSTTFSGDFPRGLPARSLLCGALSLLACGGEAGTNPVTTTATASSGGGGAGSGRACFDDAAFDAASPSTTFTGDVLPMFRRSCGLSASCHGADPGATGQPYLGPAQSAGDLGPAAIAALHAAIVDVASTKEPSMKLVAPGDPSRSFLLHKIDGLGCDALACAASGTCGAQMPQGSALAPAERDTVRRWIAQGAKAD